MPPRYFGSLHRALYGRARCLFSFVPHRAANRCVLAKFRRLLATLRKVESEKIECEAFWPVLDCQAFVPSVLGPLCFLKDWRDLPRPSPNRCRYSQQQLGKELNQEFAGGSQTHACPSSALLEIKLKCVV